MKRFLSVLLVALLLVSALPVVSLAATQYATVVDGWLRLREAPNFNAETITSYYTGTQVKILGTSGAWYHVQTPDGRVGYMYGQYLRMSGGGSMPPDSGNAYVTSHNGYGVRMRKGPGTGYRVIATYDVGTPVTVLEKGSYWCKIRINGTSGYMMTQFLNFGGGGGGGSESVQCYATIWSSNGYGVRLRTGPGKGYDKIGVYSVGTTVAVLERGAVWDRIRVGSRVGWMMNEFLRYYNSNEVTSVTLNNLSPAVGNVLCVQAISPSNATVSYEWRVGGVTVSTDPTYTVAGSDLGKVIQLKVRGVGSYTGSAKSPVTDPVVSSTQLKGLTLNTTAPVVGNVLQATVDPSTAKVLYSWKVDGYQVSNSATYTVKNSDVGKAIQLTVTGTGNYHGQLTASTSAVEANSTVTAVNIQNTTNTASGAAPAVGDTLKAVTTPTQATVTYQWMRDGAAISGATGSTYRLVTADQGHRISVMVNGVGNYTGTRTSTATDIVQQQNTRPVIDNISLPNGKVGNTYAAQLTATGGGNMTWKLVGGALHPELSLSSTGAITGTITSVGSPAAMGQDTFIFAVTATNNAGTSEIKQFTLVVEDATPVPVITTTYFPNAVAGTAYAWKLEGVSASPITWTVTGLPAGMTLTGDTVSGTPESAGSCTVTVTATAGGQSASAVFSFDVLSGSAGAPVITTRKFAAAQIGVDYAQRLEATSNTAVTWSIISGQLPSGLNLDAATGFIGGKAAADAVTSTFTVQAKDADGNTASASYTIAVSDPGKQNAPEIISQYFGDATVGEFYARVLEANTDTSVTWSIVGGSLPSGLSINQSTAQIEGTPTAAGSFEFTVQAKDQNGLTATKTFTITVKAVSHTAPEITTNSFGNAAFGEWYSRTLEATAETAVIWAVNGSLPTGLKAYENGVIEGVPVAGGTFTFTAHVMDLNGLMDSKEFSITVHTAPIITTNRFGNPEQNVYYERVLTADVEPGTSIASWKQVGGSLPDGITLYEDGRVQGTPTVAGAFEFTVRVTDGNGLTADKTFTITVDGAAPAAEEPEPEPEPQSDPEPVDNKPTITTGYFGDAKLNEYYQRVLGAEDDHGSVTWSISGSVPPGMTFSADGTIEGTPTVAGTFPFIATATDSSGQTASKEFSITVVE